MRYLVGSVIGYHWCDWCDWCDRDVNGMISGMMGVISAGGGSEMV